MKAQTDLKYDQIPTHKVQPNKKPQQTASLHPI